MEVCWQKIFAFSSVLLLASAMVGAFSCDSWIRSRRAISCLQDSLQENDSPPSLRSTENKDLTVVVIGSGWAGFSAADAISGLGNNVQVVFLDGSPRGPGGLAAGWRTPQRNRPVEMGIHGFWREYRNTFAAIQRIGLDIDQVLTPFTPSRLVSSTGTVAVAPVLNSSSSSSSSNQSSQSVTKILGRIFQNPKHISKEIASILPPPLDLALLTEFEGLTELDRMTGLGLLGAWADFKPEDRSSWLRYDRISAENLFRHVAGISPHLYDQLVSPLLHVLPMTPGYDCSAAAAVSCFHVFALQSRGAFDVRWCRGSIGEKIFHPWTKKLQDTGQVQVRGAAMVTRVEESSDGNDNNNNKTFLVTVNHGAKLFPCDAVVFAVGCTAARRLVASCPPLQSLPDLATKWNKLRGVTCVAVRLFLNKNAAAATDAIWKGMEETPVVVCGPGIGNIPSLVETGFCIYDLGRLQDEFQRQELGEDDGILVLEVDFFRANKLASMEDFEIINITLAAITAALGASAPPLVNASAVVVDSFVVRARDSVSHFGVGSASLSPPVRLRKGLYVCGDWVDRTGHASWSTEKAVVTGRLAAKALGADFAFPTNQNIDILPAAPDTTQLTVLRSVASLIRYLIPSDDIVPPAPWLLFRR